MGSHTDRHDEDAGYYEDDGWDGDLYEDEGLEDRRSRMIAVLSGSYGVSIALHVALLLILAAIVIATPILKEDVRITTKLAEPVKPYDPEAKKDVKETPEIKLPETDVQVVQIEETPPTEEPPKGKETAAADKLNDYSVADAYGPGPGAAGAKGSPLGTGRATGRGGTPKSESSVNAALRWLKRHQSPDGRWDADGWTQNCKQGPCKGPGANDGGSGFDVGVTGLAMLAYLGHGNTHRYGTFQYQVHHAQRWMRAQQHSDGTFGYHQAGEHGGIYNHALATNAMCELFAMTRDPFLKRPCQRAIDWILKAQNPNLGWKYRPRSGENDVSVTGWMFLALKAAYAAGLEIPKEAFAGAVRYMERCTSSDGITGYNSPGGASSVLTGRGDAFDAVPTMTAVSGLCRLFSGVRKTAVRPSMAHLFRDLPRWSERKTNFYYWYYGTYALFQFDGPKWKAWNKAMLKAVIPHQRSGKICEDGSWDGVGEWCAAGGRVYATAINALTLEIYYRYDRGVAHFASAKHK